MRWQPSESDAWPALCTPGKEYSISHRRPRKMARGQPLWGAAVTNLACRIYDVQGGRKINDKKYQVICPRPRRFNAVAFD